MSSEQSSNFLETTDLEALARRARALETLGLFNEALAEWRQALRIDPNYLPAWEGSARVLRRLRGGMRGE
ncbi:MAG: tetratricopeptide repeat protein [Candidatus Methylomirabilia bacterium]